MSNTPRLSLPEISSSQASKEITHNEALEILDALTQPGVTEASDPPESPVAGSLYLIIATATGAWTGYEDYIAQARGDGSWNLIAPKHNFWVITDSEPMQINIYNAHASPPAWQTISATGAFAFTDLTDVPASYSGGADKQVYVKHDESGLEFRNPASLDDLTDVVISSPSTDQILKYDGDHWVNSTAASVYTDEQAQDAIGNNLVDSSTIDFTYNDAYGTITAAVIGQPYVVSVTLPGVPDDSQLMVLHKFPMAVTFPASLTGSQGVALTAATAQTDFDVQKNGSSVGTVRWAAAGTSASFIAASSASFASGDVMKVVGPATADATLADIGITLLGTR